MMDDGVMTGMSDDDDDEGPSSPESAYNEADMMQVALDDEVAAQLAAAGPVGVAAAAAIASAKKRKRPHSFETNPSIRKRQQNRLLRKLRVRSRHSHPAQLQFINFLLPKKKLTANHLRIRDTRGTAGRRFGRHTGQTEHQLQSFRCQTTRRCCEKLEKHCNGRTGIGAGTTGPTTTARGSVTVRASAADH